MSDLPQVPPHHPGAVLTAIPHAAALRLTLLDIKPGEDIFAFAECFKVTKNIAFTRAIAFHTDRNDPIATCAAAFMLGTKNAKGANRGPKGAR